MRSDDAEKRGLLSRLVASLDYALTVYPNLYSNGPTSDPDYGVGWHYLKSLSYDAAEAAERTAILEDIIALYFPNGAPPANPNPCTLLPPCPADLDDNGLINVSDILMALGEFGCTVDCAADLNGDGAVTVTDVLLVLSQFGQPCD